MRTFRHITAQLALGLFAVSLLSGLLPVFVYHPSDPYASVQKLTFLVPWGSFFRQLHYFSSELFLLVLLLHIVLEISQRYPVPSRTSWLYSVLATLAVIGLMFTGFVLKGDQSADAAAQVALHLMEETPLLDRLVPLIKETEVFTWKFFVWHGFYLPFLLILGIWKHIGRITPRRVYWAMGLGLSALSLLLLPLPADIAPHETIDHLKGPWFFQGAENLLQLSLAPWLVNVVMFLPFALLFLYPFVRRTRWIGIALLLWLIGYTAVSLAV